MKSPPDLVLASTSVYRRELLERLRIPFECVAPGVDETPLIQESGAALVGRLARAKAQAVAARRPEAFIIGSDQAAVLAAGTAGECILGKPGSVARCYAQLDACSGRSLDFVTAVAAWHPVEGLYREFLDVTQVTFREFDTATIERYVREESPLDCAGGFKCERLGISLCRSIRTEDPTALIGLPLIGLCDMLREVGFLLP